jgi:excisionase family DNA binding protein
MKIDEAAHLERQTLRVAEAGRVLGVGRSLAYELARRGEIPTIRLGNRIVVPRAQLERLLQGALGASEAEVA